MAQLHQELEVAAELVTQYVASGQVPDGPLGTAVFHHRDQRAVRVALLTRLGPDAGPQERAAVLAWVGRFQARRSSEARALLLSGITDPDVSVRLTVLRCVGETLGGHPEAWRLAAEITSRTGPATEPDWRVRLAAWNALSIVQGADPLPHFLAGSGDPVPQVGEGMQLLSQIWAARATGDVIIAGLLNDRWEGLLAGAE